MNVRIKILNLVAGVLAVCPLAAQTRMRKWNN